MDPLSIARWQFGITTVYHYIFVPLTIGLALLTAILETAWVRTRNPDYLRATKFWGKLLLINFAIGVVTGIVQEFQFGLNWSSYSRFVGDVFGAPLAMEALIAFFLESTFLGLWIFGWDKLSPKLHAMCMWLVAIGTTASAFFILAANSFMQHPVGVQIDAVSGRPKLNDIGAVLFQQLQLVTFSHVIVACVATGAIFMVGVSAYFLARKRDLAVFKPSMRLGLWFLLVSSIGIVITGDMQAKIMTEVQPMKMAAAEAQYTTQANASFSVFSIGTLDGKEETFSIRVPGLLSFMGTGDFNGTIEGINDVQAQYEKLYGPGDYSPNIPLTYWNFRLMVGAGFAMVALSIVGLWMTRRGRLPEKRWVWRLAMLSMAAPVIGNSTGWIFTEMGRQPWTVVGLFKTADSVSPTLTTGAALTSLMLLTAVYGVLALIEVRLMVKYVQVGPLGAQEALASIEKLPPPDPDDPNAHTSDENRVLTFAY
ncbi:cytochrome ubiquinol oxidase subunit I [Nakamurella antarctica]|uniref:Cytochrome ubiquinol oxidase subunit I n=1 Tax=Nakamurella antarctica TaxID=1902245 RepID=A0A3G8ZSV7_9ACTN|nr:cytochrome ubiquinol oxidase subunit I [Nakamurella antarctica]AZI56871.1 cytochrome ubiquinol oxidase subunit I [Nakamurella antarctica]